MGDGFVKLYGDKLLRSTLWMEDPDVRLVFILMLAIADANGVVDCTGIRVLAHTLNLPVDYTEKALAVLTAPDPESRSKEEGGRRVVRDGVGWRMVNYAKYREYRSAKQESNRLRQKRHAEKKRALELTKQTPRDAGSASASASASASGLFGGLLNCWDGIGGTTVSAANREKLRNATPAIVRLSGVAPLRAGSGTPQSAVDDAKVVAWFQAACDRFKADAKTRQKGLCRLDILLGQLDQWGSEAPAGDGPAPAVGPEDFPNESDPVAAPKGQEP